MSDRKWMDTDERAEFEENRKDLIARAWDEYTVALQVNIDDGLNVGGTLENIVEFYINYRSEIEEML